MVGSDVKEIFEIIKGLKSISQTKIFSSKIPYC